MKITYALSFTLTALLLTACGGGNGGGFSGGTTGLTTSTGNQTTPTINTAIQGNTIALSRTGSATGASTGTTATSAIDKIVINGQTINFVPSDTAARRHLTGSSFDNVRYGYLKEGTNNAHLFAQGIVTTNMPTRGTATYNGSAVHVRTAGQLPEIATPSASFNVNFDQKTITGKINATQNVNLSGTISANTFSGVSTQGYTMNGHFYGNNASELGGVYRNSSGSVSGAFGAKKQ